MIVPRRTDSTVSATAPGASVPTLNCPPPLSGLSQKSHRGQCRGHHNGHHVGHTEVIQRSRESHGGVTQKSHREDIVNATVFYLTVDE